MVSTLPVSSTIRISKWGSPRTSLHTMEGEGAFSSRLRLPGRGSVMLREASLDQ